MEMTKKQNTNRNPGPCRPGVAHVNMLTEPQDELWQQYWKNIYNRFERTLGWILISIAAIILLIYGGFKLIEAIIQDPTVDIILKIGLVALIAGLAILFISALRERLCLRKKDPYRNIRR